MLEIILIELENDQIPCRLSEVTYLEQNFGGAIYWRDT